MKIFALGLAALALWSASIPEAQAMRCHAGVYRSGCVGPRGGAVYRHRYAHYGANQCYWRAGRRVCR